LALIHPPLVAVSSRSHIMPKGYIINLCKNINYVAFSEV
jgi:hypothetical protein